MTTQTAQSSDEPDAVRSTLWTAVMLGIGFMGAVDEIVFHQLLQWHNFYVHTDDYWRVFSDGLFHIFTTLMLSLGAIRLWSQRRRMATVLSSRPFWAGILIGAGGFQLFDGIVNHKLLDIHPVREGVDDILLYDLAWNLPGALLLLAGALLWHTIHREQANRLRLAEGVGDQRRDRA